MTCKGCGANLPDNAEKCGFCDRAVPKAKPVVSYPQPAPISVESRPTIDTSFNPEEHYQKKSKTTTLLLCIFLGLFGIHYFYVGKNGMGILYVLTRGVFYFGWLYDIYRIATNRFLDANGYSLE